jgi:hypothetical protein
MKYLFFDIECANCFDGKAKICEFGYVLTDEKFNVLQEDTFQINPRSKFDKLGFKKRGIKLAYPYEYYYNQPDFKCFYEKIKSVAYGAQCIGRRRIRAYFSRGNAAR